MEWLERIYFHLQWAVAGFFGALVPGAASLLAIPVLGEVPGPLQVMGICAVVLVLLVAFGAARALLVAEDAQGICGTVQLVLAQPDNQPPSAIPTKVAMITAPTRAPASSGAKCSRTMMA
mgnify:CR=1 FL=1